MTFDSTDMHAALMHELKNNLGQLAMTLDGMPWLDIPEHDTKLDEARLICQRSVERLQQALLVYKAERQALHPVIDAHSPLDLLCELNVIEQVANVCHTTIVQHAWASGQELAVHGWIYRVSDGILKDLNVCTTGIHEIPEIQRIV